MGSAETTGGVKPRRKLKSLNPAMALVETSGLKVVIIFQMAFRGCLKGGNQPKATLVDLVWMSVNPAWPAALEIPGDRAKRGNSKLIAFSRGRHTVRIPDLSTRW
jgi:hypothetical protein